MRLQLLELPTEHDGDRVHTPYILVLDEIEDNDRLEELRRATGLLETSGARGVLVFPYRVDVTEVMRRVEDGAS